METRSKTRRAKRLELWEEVYRLADGCYVVVITPTVMWNIVRERGLLVWETCDRKRRGSKLTRSTGLEVAQMLERLDIDVQALYISNVDGDETVSYDETRSYQSIVDAFYRSL